MVRVLSLTFLMILTVSCDSLSEQEEAMVGDYYLQAVSDNVPYYELRDDRSATVRKIVDGVEIAANGRWRVEDDSLVIETDSKSLTTKGGDASLVKISLPERISHPIISYNGITLSLRNSDGIQYDYHRRYQIPEKDKQDD